tara:strand:+ start:1804 stop:2814 length:1011 start_codon:yes stop_codon:yes gene_type:complete
MYIETNFVKKIKKLTYQKVKYLLWTYFVLKKLENTWIYFYLYRSFWHSVLNLNFNNISKNQKNYMSIDVDPGAGIGHQLANYNSAIWYAKKFNLIHAHTSFPNKKWEKLLGFNYSTICLENLLNKGYKKIKLPIFKEGDLIEISKIKKIIHSYRDKKIIFFLENNQGYTKQYQVAEILKEKFFSSKKRSKDKLIYSIKDFNIAVHIRAGDIMNNEKLINKRFLDINYFIKTINESLSIIKTPKKKKIHIFSESKLDSFSKLTNFKNIKFCHNLNQYKTFLHFVYADLLITSKSSFSYKAALISKGIKVSPKNFWHGYPYNDKKWILTSANGRFKNK